jgi:hypothetical protein
MLPLGDALFEFEKGRTSMHYLFYLLFCMLLMQFHSAQETRGFSQKSDKVKLPGDIALSAMAYQPDCPLKISSVDIIAYLNGGGGKTVNLRNEGGKPIKSFTIAHITTLGTSSELAINELQSNEMILPGGEMMLGDTDHSQRSLITDAVNKQMGFQGGMQFVSLSLILKIKFADGTIYTDEKTFNALRQHFKKISKCI